MISFVTGNPQKVREALQILECALGPNVVTVHAADLEELQGSPEEIVRAKCVKAAAAVPSPPPLFVIVEDVSVELAPLHGLPGPYIKPFFAKLGNAGIAELVGKYENHAARARCLYGIYDTTTRAVHIAEGSICGTIVPPRGPEHFGWDAIFQPDGHTETFAEMPPSTKNAISHRALALATVVGFFTANGIGKSGNE